MEQASNEHEASTAHPQTENNPQAGQSLENNRFLAKAKIRNSVRDVTANTESSRKRRMVHHEAEGGPSKSTPQDDKKNETLKPLPKRIRKFVDYDLSTMKNSKGGFLMDNEQDDARLLKQQQQIEELKRQRMKQAELLSQAPNVSLDKSQNPKCTVCGSVELDMQLFQVFKVAVCRKCKNEHPERFSLLTKTECKQDYLLTDPELKDSELLPHLLKPNPHQSTYSNMMLFLREQVEEYAFSARKWGSAAALDAEFSRRETAKKALKNRKFDAQLRDLRKKTRSNLWHHRQEAVHVHTFEPVPASSSSDSHTQTQQCSGCGMQCEVEIF
ncbi:hypothetical protein PCASD_02134 [Puccinia coronata f. sp. avenae]|uniref:DNA repair protein RAD14 n=1 Tax=Puccinia coronata f. sp. avenae TaxID=200324 RepID=A0A2N5VPZ2_9BASI|nr:hypothetical protein PCASD_02134 [Puccinia coronata f. sp. avenae]